jgi:ubiquinone/menaquinone biosynthesis C-methylase UbiE
MEALQEQIREEQQEAWNRFSFRWKKWDELNMKFLKPMGDEMIRLLKPMGDDIVLDVASGTGEPGLTIATLLNNGQVISADLAEGMLEVAYENAVSRGIKNFETQKCDVCELPFADNSFDAISCRFGFMFFPDIQLAAKEMVRVLKPGGRIATCVWGLPEKNPWITAINSIIKKNIELAPSSPDIPGMFRCCESRMIADLFKDAGLQNVSETEVKGMLKGLTADAYWNFMADVIVPIASDLEQADDLTKRKIKKEVIAFINKKFPDDQVQIECGALLIYGEK